MTMSKSEYRERLRELHGLTKRTLPTQLGVVLSMVVLVASRGVKSDWDDLVEYTRTTMTRIIQEDSNAQIETARRLMEDGDDG